MNKFIKILFLGTLTVLLIDFSIGSILSHYYFKQTSGLFYRTTFSIKQTEADVLVFGSSRANHHYVPEIFNKELNMSFYNTGRDGNGIFYQLAVLKAILERHSPKIIILDYYGSFEKKQSDYDKISSLLPYYHDHPEIKDIIYLKSDFEYFKLFSKIYPFNSQLLTIIMGNMDSNKERKNDFQGFTPLNGVWNKKIEVSKEKKHENIDLNKINALKEFIKLSKDSNAKLYIVYSPIFEINANQNEIKILKDILDSKKVDLLNFSFNEKFINNINLFKDVTHLNYEGAVLFSKIIASKLVLNLD